MSSRDFSVVYRAPKIVDIVFPKQDGVIGYRLNGSSQFDGSPAFAQLFTADIGRGYLDPTIDRRKLHSMPGTNHVRAVFDPDNFGSANLADAQQFWLTFQPVTSGGTGTASAPVLILTPTQLRGQSRIVISGDAPVGASVANSLKLCLARRFNGMTIRNNDSANPLFVAFEDGGPEVTIPFGVSHEFRGDGVDSDLLVRSTGGAVNFSADFSLPAFIS